MLAAIVLSLRTSGLVDLGLECTYSYPRAYQMYDMPLLHRRSYEICIVIGVLRRRYTIRLRYHYIVLRPRVYVAFRLQYNHLNRRCNLQCILSGPCNILVVCTANRQITRLLIIVGSMLRRVYRRLYKPYVLSRLYSKGIV
jgi:hypothetical protein